MVAVDQKRQAEVRRRIEDALLGMLTLEAEQIDLRAEIQTALGQMQRVARAKQEHYQTLSEATQELVRLTA